MCSLPVLFYLVSFYGWTCLSPSLHQKCVCCQRTLTGKSALVFLFSWMDSSNAAFIPITLELISHRFYGLSLLHESQVVFFFDLSCSTFTLQYRWDGDYSRIEECDDVQVGSLLLLMYQMYCKRCTTQVCMNMYVCGERWITHVCMNMYVCDMYVCERWTTQVYMWHMRMYVCMYTCVWRACRSSCITCITSVKRKCIYVTMYIPH